MLKEWKGIVALLLGNTIIVGLVISIMGSAVYITQPVGGFNFHKEAFLFDDFPADNGVTGQIGSFGWQKTATAIVLGTTPINNDVSIENLNSGAVANQNNSIYLNTQGVFNYDTTFNPNYTVTTQARWYTEGGAQGFHGATYRFGWVVNPPPVSPPSAWYGVEVLTTDDNWFCVSKVGGLQTRTDTGVAVNADPVEFFDRIKLTMTPTQLTCSINESTPVTVTTNLFSAAGFAGSVAIQVVNNATATNKGFELDYVAIDILGITR